MISSPKTFSSHGSSKGRNEKWLTYPPIPFKCRRHGERQEEKWKISRIFLPQTRKQDSTFVEFNEMLPGCSSHSHFSRTFELLNFFNKQTQKKMCQQSTSGWLWWAIFHKVKMLGICAHRNFATFCVHFFPVVMMMLTERKKMSKKLIYSPLMPSLRPHLHSHSTFFLWAVLSFMFY